MVVSQGFAVYRLFYYIAHAWALSTKSSPPSAFLLPRAPGLPIGPLQGPTLLGHSGVGGFVALCGQSGVLGLLVLVGFTIPDREWDFPSNHQFSQCLLKIFAGADVFCAVIVALVKS